MIGCIQLQLAECRWYINEAGTCIAASSGRATLIRWIEVAVRSIVALESQQFPEKRLKPSAEVLLFCYVTLTPDRNQGHLENISKIAICLRANILFLSACKKT